MESRTLLLVSPPVLFGHTWWVSRLANKPHLASLAGYVRDLAEVQVIELDTTIGDTLDDQLSEVEDALTSSVSLVGISCWTSLHYLGTLAVAERVRRLAPDVPIVIGGHHATALPSDFTHAHCDWVVRGDGEHPLRALCEEWPSRPDEMQVVTGGAFDQSDPDHIDWARYGRPGQWSRTLWLGTSRGCAFQCRFCVEPQRGAAYSRYSVEDTLEILERLVETHEPEVVGFTDPLFGSSRRWTEAFLAGLERLSLPLRFWAQTRADLVTPALIEAFKRCRFMVDFGLDTASATMVGRMEKSANPGGYLSRYRQILGHANAIGLTHSIYLVFNFPGETPQTTMETRRFIDSLEDGGVAMSGALLCQSYFILPGTHAFFRMAENADRYGTVIRHPGWWRARSDHRTLATDVLPSADWTDREGELRAFEVWNHTVNARWIARYPPEVIEFRQAMVMG